MATQIFSFCSTFIENLHLLPDGTLLLSTLVSTGLLYTLDPRADQPRANQVTTFENGITGLSGIAALPGDGLYAVIGGLHVSFGFQNNSMQLFVVSLPTGTVRSSTPVRNVTALNGLAALPRHPRVLLSADSKAGQILRIDTHTSAVSVAFQDAALAAVNSTVSTVPAIGVNGLRIRGRYLYFTNSSQRTLARVLISDDGDKIGAVEILAVLPPESIPDDFDFDYDGNAYVAMHPSSVVRVTPDGRQTTIGNGTLFRQPTSVALAQDGKSIFVSTGGTVEGTTTYGGQIIQVLLDR